MAKLPVCLGVVGVEGTASAPEPDGVACVGVAGAIRLVIAELATTTLISASSSMMAAVVGVGGAMVGGGTAVMILRRLVLAFFF